MEQQPAASIFLTLQESALGHAMRSSPALYPAVEILHIIGFVVLVGSILALDVRLLDRPVVQRRGSDVERTAARGQVQRVQRGPRPCGRFHVHAPSLRLGWRLR